MKVWEVTNMRQRPQLTNLLNLACNRTSVSLPINYCVIDGFDRINPLSNP